MLKLFTTTKTFLILSFVLFFHSNGFSQTINGSFTALDFGPIVKTALYSNEGSFTVGGTGLTGDLIITPPSGYEISTSTGSGFTTSAINLGSGTIATVPIYVRFTPNNTANGANNGQISITSTGAGNTPQVVDLFAKSVEVEPTTVGNITFGSLTPSSTSMTVNFTSGNGVKRIVVAKAGSGVTFTPTDGVAHTGVNSDFSLAADQGSGDKIVYDGTGNSVTITNLASNRYYFAIYEYNEGTGTSQNYLVTGAVNGTQTIEAGQYANDDNATTLYQDFNSLTTTGTSSSMPTGWFFNETGGDANYTAGDGSSGTSGVYSFGTGVATERGLGSLTDGTITTAYIGTKLVNNSGATITSILFQFLGKQWRYGGSGIKDKLDFQYSTDATSLTNGTWTDFNDLDFESKISTGATGPLNGELSANQTTFSSIISGLTLTNGSTIWFRWIDSDIAGNDDALSLDEINITPFSSTAAGNVGISTYSNINVTNDVTLQNDVTVNSTANVSPGKKVILNGYKLTINGRLLGTPNFVGGGNSSLEIGGSGGIGTINFDQTTPGTTNKLKNLTLNRSGATVTLGNALNISDLDGSVNLTAGTLATGGNLTLLSTFDGTARIGAITSGVSDLTGDVIAQRYMQGTNIVWRNWRTMGPTTNNFTVAQLVDDIFVTGPGGTSNGFDANGTNSSVMFYQENTTGGRGWKSVTNTTHAIDPGIGMLVFYRGDRTQTSSITNSSTVPNATTIDITGPINKGNIPVNLSYTNTADPTNDGWNFLSNPYPSPILWNNTITKGPSVDNFISVWVPNSDSYLADDDIIIGAHQGFFVQTTATSQSVTFEENDKVSSGFTPYFKTSLSPFVIKMFSDSVRHDVIKLAFSTGASKNYIFKEDGLKMLNPKINIGYKTPNDRTVQVNTVPTPSANSTDTFTVSTTSSVSGNFWLTFEDKAILPANKNVYLVDGFNNNIIDVKSTDNYTFAINNSNSATYGNRFKLIITDQFSALPVKLTSFTGEKLGASNLLKWTSAGEKNLINYEVEKSVDGKNFESIGLVKATNTSTNTNYSFVDENFSTNSVNYYRLKINENKGVNSYSNIISISNNATQNALVEVYPNPAQNSISIKLEENNTFESAVIFDINGKAVLNTKTAQDIDVSALLPGVYTIQVNAGLSEQKVKFIKH